MALTVRNGSNIEFTPEDGGCVTNVSSHIVLLESPTINDLKALWIEFDAELRAHMAAIFKMRSEEVVQKFGRLKLQTRTENKRGNQLYGFITRNDIPRLIQLQTTSVVEALIEMGKLPRLTVKGRARRNNVNGEGPVSETIEGLELSERYDLIERLVAGDLDRLLLLIQACATGWSALDPRIQIGASNNWILQT